jgi:transglutaminase-like putative cysteine protease
MSSWFRSLPIGGRTVAGVRGSVTTPRALALLSGLALIGSFLRVLYGILDVVGGVRWLVPLVLGSLVFGTAVARLLSPRHALGLGFGMLLAGASLYVLLVPEHHDRILTVGFLVDFVGYLTGTTVLRFLRVDLWVLAVAPGPVFATWYLLLCRRYDLGTLLGGLGLGFFVLTGDAGWTTTLVGSLSAFGVLGFGTLDITGGSREQAEQLGGVFVVGVIAAQALRNTDPWNGGWAGSSSNSAGDGGMSTFGGDVTATKDRVGAFDHVTLSPTVRFTVTADQVAYWHVASFDRYTGEGWVRSGESTAYAGPLDPPPGKTTPLRQTYFVETRDRTMPAAWKPVATFDAMTERTRVTSTGGFDPKTPLEAGESYSVVSQVLDADPARLRGAGTAYPRHVTDRYLQLPESTPSRLRRKAHEIVGERTGPYDAARAIEGWLETNKSYSLEVDSPNGDAADAFVFGMDRGYCVHYATAMAVLLRTLGVPVRFVNGYTPGERVAENRWVVRGLDSHTWVAIYVPGAGWVPFDPTPADPRRTAERSLLETARDERIPDIDTNASRSSTWTATPAQEAVSLRRESPQPATEQRSTGTPLATTDASSSPATGARTRGGPSPLFQGERLSSAFDGVDRLTLVTAIIGAILGVNRLRLVERGYRAVWLRWQPATDSPRDDVERAFERLEYLFERKNRPRSPEETPRQYIAALHTPVDPRVHRVVQLYEHARYAGSASREHADEAIELVDELVRE